MENNVRFVRQYAHLREATRELLGRADETARALLSGGHTAWLRLRINAHQIRRDLAIPKVGISPNSIDFLLEKYDVTPCKREWDPIDVG